jgi:hypothetical protein
MHLFAVVVLYPHGVEVMARNCGHLLLVCADEKQEIFKCQDGKMKDGLTMSLID